MSLSTSPPPWREAKLEALQAPGDYTFVGGPFGSDLTTQDYIAKPGVPVIRGTNLGGSESRFVDDGFVYVSEEKADSFLRNMAYPGDLIFTQRGTLGQVAIIPLQARFPRYVISQSQMKLTVDSSKVDRRFVYYAFRSPKSQARLLSRTQATGVPHINLGILKNFAIPLPSLPEQHRIADILDKANAIRWKRREANDQATCLTSSLFLNLFGNSVHNEGNWPLVPVAEAGEVQLGRQRAPKYQTGRFTHPYMRVANVFEDRIDLSDVLSMDFDDNDFATFRLRYGDILLNEGQSTELVGRPAMWRNEIPDCCFQNTLVRFRPKPGVTVPEYALQVFLFFLQRGQFARISSKTSSVAHLGAGRFSAMLFPLPPYALQQRYAQQRQHAFAIGQNLREHLGESNNLFDSLVQRAFRGEL
jgi:type I restriction enzyme S subunit